MGDDGDASAPAAAIDGEPHSPSKAGEAAAIALVSADANADTNGNGKGNGNAIDTNAPTTELATCDTADALLAENDSAQDMVPHAAPSEDVEMDGGRSVVDPVRALDPELRPRFEEVSAGPLQPQDVEMHGDDGNNATSDSATEAAAEAAAVAAIVAETEIQEKEHPALAHERRWFGRRLPAFVRKAYGEALDDKDEASIKSANPMMPPCEDCLKLGKKALASVECIEESCTFRATNVCSACYHDQHCGEADKTHRLRVLKACPHCHLSRVNVWCTACDLSFCVDCFVDVHSGVKCAQEHTPFRLLSTPGSMFDSAQWTPHFRGAVEAQLQLDTKVSVKTADAVATGGSLKRKRPEQAPQEVIWIDDESDDGEGKPTPTPTPKQTPTPKAKPTRPPTPPALAVSLPMSAATSNGSSWVPTATPPIRSATVAHMQYMQGQPVYRAIMGGATGFSTSGTSTPMATTPISSITMPVSAPYHANGVNGAAWAVPTTPIGSQQGRSSAESSPGVTTLTNPALGVVNLMNQNPIEHVLYERLNKLCDGVHQAEQQIAVLNGQVMEATYRSVQKAHALMEQLKQYQQRVQQIRTKRDHVVVQLVAQSRAIIAKVKLLRLDLLGDIPQVQVECYRRCLQLAQQIRECEAVVASINAQMQETLAQCTSMSTEVFHHTVSSLSSAIQSHEQDALRYREERENEVVRLVQYHPGIRDMLKRAVQQQQHIRHQQEQQQQQQQEQQQQQQQLLRQQQQQQQQMQLQMQLQQHMMLTQLQQQQHLRASSMSLPEPTTHPAYEVSTQQQPPATSQPIPMAQYLVATSQHPASTHQSTSSTTPLANGRPPSL